MAIPQWIFWSQSRDRRPPTLSLSITTPLPRPFVLSQSASMFNHWNHSVSAPMLDVILSASSSTSDRIESAIDSMLEIAAEIAPKLASLQTVESLLQNQEHRHFALKLLFHRINSVQNGSASSSAVAVKDCRFMLSSSSYKVIVHLIGFALRFGPFSVSSFNDARC